MCFVTVGGELNKSTKMWCLVNLPNGTTSGVQCDPKKNSQECLEKVGVKSIIVRQTEGKCRLNLAAPSKSG